MSKDEITRTVDELAGKVQRMEPWRPYTQWSEEEIAEILSTIEGAARILAKGVTTRSASDPLTRLLVRLAKGDKAIGDDKAVRELAGKVDEAAGKALRDGVTNDDITAAQRLARKHLYAGHEPYSPAIFSIASMLAEHRREWASRCEELRAERDALRKTIDDMLHDRNGP